MIKETLGYFLKKITDAQNTFVENPETDTIKKFEIYHNQIRDIINKYL